MSETTMESPALQNEFIRQWKELMRQAQQAVAPLSLRGREHHAVVLEKLDAHFNLLVDFKAAALMAAIAEARKRSNAGPELCARCLRMLTTTSEQLVAYIEQAAEQASWSAWPREVFIRKLSAAMRPGDEITFVAAGAVSIRRPDGTTFVVFQRES